MRMRTVTAVAVGAFVLYCAGLCLYRSGFDGSDSKDRIAATQADQFIRGCRAFRDRSNTNGPFPATLLELVEPRDGRSAAIEGGKSATLDPWGNPYRYALVETETGPMPYVWCERIRNGKLLLIGVRLTTEGKIQPFGLPE